MLNPDMHDSNENLNVSLAKKTLQKDSREEMNVEKQTRGFQLFDYIDANHWLWTGMIQASIAQLSWMDLYKMHAIKKYIYYTLCEPLKWHGSFAEEARECENVSNKQYSLVEVT